MEKTVIYGVFAMEVELPKMSNRYQELKNLAESMKSMDEKKQKQGRFVRAYARLEDAVTECMDGNGWLITRTIESPENVMNGKFENYYYPMAIEVNK